MSDDVMARLAAAQPLPRGERLATWLGSKSRERFPLPLWRRLLRCSPFAHHIVQLAWPTIGEDEPSKAATLVRRWAAPLRRCREQRQRLRAELRRIPFAARLAAMLDHRGEP